MRDRISLVPRGFPSYAFFAEWAVVDFWLLMIFGAACLWYAWRTGNVRIS